MAEYSKAPLWHSSSFKIDASRRKRGQPHARSTTLKAIALDLLSGIAR